MHRVTKHPGEVLYSQGDPADYAYLILSGQFATERNGITLTIDAGTVIGFSAFVKRPYGATATALETCELLAFTRRELRGMIRSDPDRALLIIDGIIDLVGKLNAASTDHATV
jgi:CRP-like cAMP-binding protein